MAQQSPCKSSSLQSLLFAALFFTTICGQGVGCANPVGQIYKKVVAEKEPELVELLEVEEFAETARQLSFGEEHDSVISQMSYEVPPAPAALSSIPETDVWHMTLQEAILVALEQNTIIPVESEFLGAGNLLFNPEAAPSYFDPAIQKSSLQGMRGTAAAESDFISRISTQFQFDHDENIQNNLFSGGLAPGEVLRQNTGDIAHRWEKPLRTGGTVALRNEIDFDETNAPSRLFTSAFDSQLSLDFVQPLWQGAGREFTAIAGPRSLISDRTPSMDQGIVIAHLNEKISEQELRQILQRLVRDVTDVYWDLYFAHRRFAIETRTHDAVYEIWKKAQAKLNQGVGGGAADEAQAHENYLAAKARMEDAESQIALAAIRFRRMLNLPYNAHQEIIPFDSPELQNRDEEWVSILATAFANRVELRTTKLNVRSLELQLKAAKKYAKPRLDFVGNMHTNGFGDELFHSTDRSTEVPESSLNNLYEFDQTGWSAGLVLSFPVNRQLQRTLVCQLELRLAKLRAALSAQEFEITRELRHAQTSLERWERLVQTNQERVQAAQKQVRALQAAFPTGRTSIDLLVRAQATLALAETEYERSLSEYHKALAELEYRQGILLEASQITLQP